MIDLNKISSTIQTEIDKALSAERKRSTAVLKAAIDSINNPEAVTEETPLPKKTASKKASPKKAAPSKKEEPVEEEASTTAEGEIAYDISEVADEEVEDSMYANWTAVKLRKEVEKRKLYAPSEWGQLELAKYLIFDDEENEE